jgi:hypothetical protein
MLLKKGKPEQAHRSLAVFRGIDMNSEKISQEYKWLVAESRKKVPTAAFNSLGASEDQTCVADCFGCVWLS